MNEKIDDDFLQFVRRQSEKDNSINIIKNTVFKHGIWDSIENAEKQKMDFTHFSTEIRTDGVEDQKTSGRCWIYAAFHMLKPLFLEQNSAEDFQFSHEYIAFYDLLEKSNFFLEIILETLELKADDRLLAFKLARPIQDAGQWDMFCSIVKKYGVVPSDAMKKNAISENTIAMIAYLSDLLRGFACDLRKLYKNRRCKKQVRSKKYEYLAIVYRFLCICMGTPPDQFELVIKHTDGSVQRQQGMTPRRFYCEYIPITFIEDSVAVVSMEMEKVKFGRSYSVKYLGNVWENGNVRYLNVPMDEFECLILKQLKQGQPVWFGCDVRHDVDKIRGVLAMDNYNYASLGHMKLTREENLAYGITQLTHAMVFCGVLERSDGSIEKWLAKNSYGKLAGHEGYVCMTKEWFYNYVYEIVINKKYLDEAQMRQYEAAIEELPPWNQLGALAD